MHRRPYIIQCLAEGKLASEAQLTGLYNHIVAIMLLLVCLFVKKVGVYFSVIYNYDYVLLSEIRTVFIFYNYTSHKHFFMCISDS